MAKASDQGLREVKRQQKETTQKLNRVVKQLQKMPKAHAKPARA